jgi:uncharacterized protein (TIGR00266 family)
MNLEVQHAPSYAIVIAHLDAGEAVIAEGGAMVSMDTQIKIHTSAGKEGDSALGGLFKGLKRMVAGESFFQNRYVAEGSAGHITFAPALQGDIAVYQLAEGTLLIQSSSFLCSGPDVEVDAKWGGARTFFGGEGLIMLKATGTGPVAFNSFGGIKEIQVDGNFIVDTGHIVAFEDSLQFKVTSFGRNKGFNFKSFILGGEGLVCEFSGSGRLWIQTRNTQRFGTLLGRQLPDREN